MCPSPRRAQLVWQFAIDSQVTKAAGASCCCQAASVDLMSSKDARLGLMGEILHHMGVVKALGWEGVLAAKVRQAWQFEWSCLQW